MKVYLVMFSEDFEADVLDSIFAKKGDAELHLERCIKSDKYNSFNWHIEEGRVR